MSYEAFQLLNLKKKSGIKSTIYHYCTNMGWENYTLPPTSNRAVDT